MITDKQSMGANNDHNQTGNFIIHKEEDDKKVLRFRKTFLNTEPNLSDFMFYVEDLKAIELKESLTKLLFDTYIF